MHKNFRDRSFMFHLVVFSLSMVLVLTLIFVALNLLGVG